MINKIKERKIDLFIRGFYLIKYSFFEWFRLITTDNSIFLTIYSYLFFSSLNGED